MRSKAESWVLRPDMATSTPRVPKGTEYHRVFAGEERRIVRGLVAIILLFAGLIGFAQLCLAVASTIDSRLLGRTGFTPLQHAAGAFALALLIPYSMLLQRWLYHVPARSLHSVAGRFRFGVFGRALLAFGPFLLVVMSVGFLLTPGETIPWRAADLVAFFIIGMTLTPLAAAGEEYGLRGLMFRVVGSWTRGPLAGAILGITVTTVVFSLLHGTLDPYILGSGHDQEYRHIRRKRHRLGRKGQGSLECAGRARRGQFLIQGHSHSTFHKSIGLCAQKRSRRDGAQGN